MGTKHVERLILKTTRAYFEHGKYINCRTTQLKSFDNVYILGKLKHICQYRRANLENNGVCMKVNINWVSLKSQRINIPLTLAKIFFSAKNI